MNFTIIFILGQKKKKNIYIIVLKNMIFLPCNRLDPDIHDNVKRILEKSIHQNFRK